MVLDGTPARGISRRRQTVERVGRLASAVGAGDVRAIATARRDLHGALEPFGAGGPVEIASDVGGEIDAAILAAVDTLGGVSTLAQIRDIAAARCAVTPRSVERRQPPRRRPAWSDS